MELNIVRYVPFSILWIFRRAIGDASTVLDLGCADGQFMRDVSIGKDWRIVGVDIYQPYLKKAKKQKIYERLIKGDIERIAMRLIKQGKKFDVVFCSQILEHLPKAKGKRLLLLVDRLAFKRSIFGTPNGYMEQGKEYIRENPFHRHMSGWTKDDFTKMGYVVRGYGFKYLWSRRGPARDKNKIVMLTSTLISYLFAPLDYWFPQFAAGIISVKKYGK